MPLGAWLSGSYPSFPGGTINVTVNGNLDTLALPAGNYYLHHDNANLSLLEAFADTLVSHTEVPDVAVALLQNRLVRITSNPAITIDFTTSVGSLLLRTLLGYAGNITAQTSQTATLYSPILWVPGRPEDPEDAVLGASGRPELNMAWSASASGAHVSATKWDERRTNDFSFRFVPNARVWTPSELGGEYITFWLEVCVEGRQFTVYRQTLNDEASTTPVSFTSGNRLGPYKYKPPTDQFQFSLKNEIAKVQRLHPIVLPVIVVSEYA